MSKHNSSSRASDWIEAKERAQNTNTSEETKSEKRASWIRRQRYFHMKHPSSLEHTTLDNMLTYNECFIARDFHNHGVSDGDIASYIDIRSSIERQISKWDVLYHVEGHCECDECEDEYVQITVKECTLLRRGEYSDDDVVHSDATARAHIRGACSHGSPCATPQKQSHTDIEMTENSSNTSEDDSEPSSARRTTSDSRCSTDDSDSEEQSSKNKSDLQRLLDGEKEVIDGVYVEDDDEDNDDD